MSPAWLLCLWLVLTSSLRDPLEEEGREFRKWQSGLAVPGQMEVAVVLAEEESRRRHRRGLALVA